jgi:hypothetical protein
VGRQPFPCNWLCSAAGLFGARPASIATCLCKISKILMTVVLWEKQLNPGDPMAPESNPVRE